jgi:hypothetical protein
VAQAASSASANTQVAPRSAAAAVLTIGSSTP